jgi:hypothetical protein
MFSNSLGKRLIYLVIFLSASLVALMLYIALTTHMQMLRSLMDAQFRQQHAALTNQLSVDLATVTRLAEHLVDMTGEDMAWSADVLEPEVGRVLGTGMAGHIATVNFYQRTAPRQIITFDYQPPEAAATAPDLPIITTLTDADAIRDAWIVDAAGADSPFWYGPTPSLNGSVEAEVMAYVVPIAGQGAVWVELPPSALQATLQTLLAVETNHQVNGYAFIINDAQAVIASFNAEPVVPAPGRSLPSTAKLPKLNVPTHTKDLFNGRDRVFVLNDIIPQTGWRLVHVVPDRLLILTFPYQGMTKLFIVTVVGMSVLAGVGHIGPSG